MNIPVVFTQKYRTKDIAQDYLGVALRQAQQFNSEVVLVGDENSTHFGGAFYPMADFFGEAAAFAPHYRHMCSNPYEFELYNLQEHFILKALMQETGYDVIFSCDSDIMIYRDVSEVLPLVLGDCVAALTTTEYQPQYRWVSSGCNAFWTLRGIQDFCDLIMEMYTTADGIAKLKEKWDWHQSTGKPGGICDMTLLWHFTLRYPTGNMVRVLTDGSTFDDNINSAEGIQPNEYEMESGMKHIDWMSGMPYGHNLRLDRPVRFNTLHFQGNLAKRRMAEYVVERRMTDA